MTRTFSVLKDWTPRYSASVANLVAAAVGTGAQLLAVLAVTHFDSLENAGAFTLAFAVFAPLQMAASMNFAELIIARRPGFSDPLPLLLARTVVTIPLFLAALVVSRLTGGVGLLALAALIGGSRFCDLVSEICQAQCRAEGRYSWLLASRIVLFFSFVLLLVLFLFGLRIAAAPGVAWAFFLANVGATATDMWVVRAALDLARRTYPSPRQISRLVTANFGRGMASLLNSYSSNIPRYVLHFMVSPAAQAAYSMLVGFCRLALLLIQSLVYPHLAKLQLSSASRDHRSVGGFILFCIAISAAATLPLSGGWLAGAQLGLIHALNPEILRTISKVQGLVVITSTMALFLRYAIWHVAIVSLPQKTQLAASAIGVVLMAAVCIFAIRGFEVVGAAVAEFVVNLIICAFVLIWAFELNPGRFRNWPWRTPSPETTDIP